MFQVCKTGEAHAFVANYWRSICRSFKTNSILDDDVVLRKNKRAITEKHLFEINKKILSHDYVKKLVLTLKLMSFDPAFDRTRRHDTKTPFLTGVWNSESGQLEPGDPSDLIAYDVGV